MGGFGAGKGGGVNVFEMFARKAASPFDADKLAETFRRRPDATWSAPEAYLALLLSASMVDGTFSDHERQLLHWISRRSRALRDLSLEALSAANDAVNRALQAEGALGDACDSLPADLRAPVFAHCCQLALVDGDLSPAETRYLQDLAGALKLDQADASKILEVMLIAAS